MRKFLFNYCDHIDYVFWSILPASPLILLQFYYKFSIGAVFGAVVVAGFATLIIIQTGPPIRIFRRIRVKLLRIGDKVVYYRSGLTIKAGEIVNINVNLTGEIVDLGVDHGDVLINDGKHLYQGDPDFITMGVA